MGERFHCGRGEGGRGRDTPSGMGTPFCGLQCDESSRIVMKNYTTYAITISIGVKSSFTVKIMQ